MTKQDNEPQNLQIHKIRRKQIYLSLANKPQNLQIRQIRRKQIYLSLAIAAGLGFLVYRCVDSNEEEIANEPIDAVFYQNTAQCEADIKKQQNAYVILQKQYQDGQLAQQPAPPPMEVKDCAPQMLAAQQAYHKKAPVYALMADCQAEGVRCEATRPGEQPPGYRPVYGGTYIEPYQSPSYIYILYGGSQHRVFETRTVYQSTTSGNIVTPYGREISQSTTGRVTVPRHTTFVAPSRPTGTSATGTIRGRSSQGFGSSSKSTGSGGK